MRDLVKLGKLYLGVKIAWEVLGFFLVILCIFLIGALFLDLIDFLKLMGF